MKTPLSEVNFHCTKADCDLMTKWIEAAVAIALSRYVPDLASCRKYVK